MCAILGPSGSGKTVLLNVLARRPIKGARSVSEVLVNDCPMSNSQFRRAASFVEVEDDLVGSFTAWETVEFSSRLAGPR